MLAGRFLPIVLVLALAGSLARKQPVPATAGTFPTGTPLFAALLVGIVLIVVGAHVLPGARARADPGAARAVSLRNAPRSLLDREILLRAARDSVLKLDPRRMARNPVMFVVEVGSVLVTVCSSRPQRHPTASSPGSSPSGSGSRCCSRTSPRRSPRAAARRRPTTLRKTRAETIAHRRRPDGSIEDVAELELRRRRRGASSSAGEVIPGDGDVVEGIASVDESAITGESAPVIRESGGDRSAVTGGTRVLSDRIVVRDHGASPARLPRPHDRARRRRRAPEDAERDRAQHPARRA